MARKQVKHQAKFDNYDIYSVQEDPTIEVCATVSQT